MAAGKNRKRSAGSLKAFVSGRNKYLDKLLNDRYLRLLVTSALGGGWNFIYALYHLILAVFFRSYWFLTMGVYYLFVCGMRADALRLKNDGEEGSVCRKAVKRNALLTFGLAIIFSGIVSLTIAGKRNMVYNTIVAISLAAFTFYCVIIAIINLARLKKDRSVQKLLLRNCSMVCALGSLFGLERVLLGTFGSEDAHFILVMEAATGAGIFLIILAFGVNLLMIASNIRKDPS